LAICHRIQWGNNEIIYDLVHYSEISEEKDWAMPMSLAAERYAKEVPEEWRSIEKKQFRIFINNSTNEKLMEKVRQQGSGDKPNQGCANYVLLMDLELSDDEDEEKYLPENRYLWSDKENKTDEEVKIKERYRTPGYLEPHYYLGKKRKKINIPANYTNQILKLRTGTYPLMHLLKHRYKNNFYNSEEQESENDEKMEEILTESMNGRTLNNDCFFCQGSRETLAHIIYDCPKYQNLRAGIKNKVENGIEASQMLLRDKIITDWDTMDKINLFTLRTKFSF
jgi:hypothetical protein